MIREKLRKLRGGSSESETVKNRRERRKRRKREQQKAKLRSVKQKLESAGQRGVQKAREFEDDGRVRRGATESEEMFRSAEENARMGAPVDASMDPTDSPASMFEFAGGGMSQNVDQMAFIDDSQDTAGGRRGGGDDRRQGGMMDDGSGVAFDIDLDFGFGGGGDE